MSSPNTPEPITHARAAPDLSPSHRSGASELTTTSPASASAPATTPEPSARTLNARTSSSSPRAPRVGAEEHRR